MTRSRIPIWILFGLALSASVAASEELALERELAILDERIARIEREGVEVEFDRERLGALAASMDAEILALKDQIAAIERGDFEIDPALKIETLGPDLAEIGRALATPELAAAWTEAPIPEFRASQAPAIAQELARTGHWLHATTETRHREILELATLACEFGEETDDIVGALSPIRLHGDAGSKKSWHRELVEIHACRILLIERMLTPLEPTAIDRIDVLRERLYIESRATEDRPRRLLVKGLRAILDRLEIDLLDRSARSADRFAAAPAVSVPEARADPSLLSQSLAKRQADKKWIESQIDRIASLETRLGEDRARAIGERERLARPAAPPEPPERLGDLDSAFRTAVGGQIEDTEIHEILSRTPGSRLGPAILGELWLEGAPLRSAVASRRRELAELVELCRRRAVPAQEIYDRARPELLDQAPTWREELARVHGIRLVLLDRLLADMTPRELSRRAQDEIELALGRAETGGQRRILQELLEVVRTAREIRPERPEGDPPGEAFLDATASSCGIAGAWQAALESARRLGWIDAAVQAIRQDRSRMAGSLDRRLAELSGAAGYLTELDPAHPLATTFRATRPGDAPTWADELAQIEVFRIAALHEAAAALAARIGDRESLLARLQKERALPHHRGLARVFDALEEIARGDAEHRR